MRNSPRIGLMLSYDALIVGITMILAINLLYEKRGIMNCLEQNVIFISVVTLIFLIIFIMFRLYNRVWAYASIGELIVIVEAVTVGSVLTISLASVICPLPHIILLLHWSLTILFIGGGRLAWRMIIDRYKSTESKPRRRAIIIGAGDAGVMVARELKYHNSDILPVGFVDDDHQKQKTSILGLPVLGNRNRIPDIVKTFTIDLIIIAMPSVKKQVIRRIVDICGNTEAEMRILPGIYQIIEGKVSVKHLRPVQLEDLLHREPVQVDLQEIAGYLREEVVLITGAGGSIGSELCRQVALFNPGKLILLGHGENSIHKIWFELREKCCGISICTEIADIRDKQRIEYIFQKYRPGVVFHAAAHKHVPLMEDNPYEAVQTNVFGTINVAEAASKMGTKIFVMISTDKAVNPSSVMGATKRLAELIVLQMGKIGTSRYTAVRFGNVLGSNGSVVPIFQKQVDCGGPVTVTHPQMKRYFMTIPEAVQLVIQAGAMVQGGEIFVLDMGKPVNIVDLARDIIRLSGLEPEKDISITFTGIRPGEKLFEELLTTEEGSCATRHKRIFMARLSAVDFKTLEAAILNLSEKGLYCTAEDIFNVLSDAVPNTRCCKGEQTG